MIRTLAAAFVVLTSSAWAQTPEPALQTAPSAEAAPPVAAAVPAIPTDPMQLAQFALANAREPGQCRFAFTRLSTTAAQSGWSDAQAEIAVRFDPRLALGQRWTVQRAARQQRAIQRAFEREDRKGLPSDLITLTVEGEWTFENLTFVRETPDRYVYSYQPRIIEARSSSDTGKGIVEQLVGEVEISRQTGHVVSSTLREPPAEAVRALGIVRVHHALFRSNYVARVNGLTLIDSGTQMMSMSAILSSTEVTTAMRFTDIEAICDPAEVARIAATEAAAPRRR